MSFTDWSMNSKDRHGRLGNPWSLKKFCISYCNSLFQDKEANIDQRETIQAALDITGKNFVDSAIRTGLKSRSANQQLIDCQVFQL